MSHEFSYATHLPVLMRVLEVSEGDILELGCGATSTPFLHWAAFRAGRRLVSYESDARYYATAKQFASIRHDVTLVDEWDAAPIEREWGVAFVDHAPAIRRREEVKRLAWHARYVVVHDTCGRDERHYHYRDVFPLYRYQFQFGAIRPKTSVLSNFVDVTGLCITTNEGQACGAR